MMDSSKILSIVFPKGNLDVSSKALSASKNKVRLGQQSRAAVGIDYPVVSRLMAEIKAL